METTKSKWVLGHKVTPYDTTGDYDLMMGETPAKVPGPPPHLHQSFKEVFLVVEGEMDFIVDGEAKKISAGESIDIPPNTLHTFGNNSDKPCKWINIHSPKGFREFFESLGVEESDPEAQQKSVAQETIQKVLQTAADYDMIIKL
ncbi:cupin domain-containing protein [Aegicerativicinus sediminis]|uniref:cupin domain-containing protein n=1 Tax=Aegicerativicinus sediminis TaxID=2893202 RepID=UPI001E5F2297|nr:cupin domain-containing protein [Aegicerativicinus sediminis]